jgi:hypothetical protein
VALRGLPAHVEGWRAEVLGAAHANLTDVVIVAHPIARWGGFIGPIDGARMMVLTRTYALSFAERAARGSPSALLDKDDTSYHEVTLSCPRPEVSYHPRWSSKPRES